MGYGKNSEKRFQLEMVAALVLFFAAGWLRRAAPQYTSDPTLILAIKLLPIIPILLIGWAVWTMYGRSDELQRQTILKMAACGGLLSLLIFLIWPILVPVGLPVMTGKLAMLAIGCTTLASGAVISFLGYRADFGVKQGLIRMIPLVSFLASIAATIVVVRDLLPAHLSLTVHAAGGLAGMLISMAIFLWLRRRFDA